MLTMLDTILGDLHTIVLNPHKDSEKKSVS